jgi:hypothetical protein
MTLSQSVFLEQGSWSLDDSGSRTKLPLDQAPAIHRHILIAALFSGLRRGVHL